MISLEGNGSCFILCGILGHINCYRTWTDNCYFTHWCLSLSCCDMPPCLWRPCLVIPTAMFRSVGTQRMTKQATILRQKKSTVRPNQEPNRGHLYPSLVSLSQNPHIGEWPT